jgi:hypothetical protein
MLICRRSLQVLALVCLLTFAACARLRSPSPQVVRGPGGSSFWRATENGYNAYLRFYPDGTVIGVNSRQSPAETDSWLERPFECSGRYSINGSSLKFSLTDPSCTVDYSGVIKGSSLKLNWVSHINNRRGEDYYELVVPGATENNVQSGVAKEATAATASSTKER